jgi:hypothetical protein
MSSGKQPPVCWRSESISATKECEGDNWATESELRTDVEENIYIQIIRTVIWGLLDINPGNKEL